MADDNHTTGGTHTTAGTHTTGDNHTTGEHHTTDHTGLRAAPTAREEHR